MEWSAQNIDALYKLCLVIGGIFGLYLAAKRVAATNQQAEAQIKQAAASARQADLGQTKLVTDLFAQAVGQLRDEKLEIRLLAVYTLRRLANDFPDYRTAVLELLAGYIRENQSKWGDAEPPIDILEINKVMLTYLSGLE
jgi:hypothetical protein